MNVRLAEGPQSCPPDWNDWLCAAAPDAARFCQSSHWLTIEHDVNRAAGHYVWVENDGGRVAGAALSLRKPAFPSSLRDLAKCFVPGARPRELICLEGPVLTGAAEVRAAALDAILDGIDEVARRSGADLIRIQPSAPLAPEPWTRRGYAATEWMTSLVDLTRDEQALQKGMRQAARKGIRKSREAGISVAQCPDYESFAAEFRAAYMESVRLETGRRRPPRNDRRWWELDRGRHYRFFVARDPAGRVHATLGSYAFGGVAKEIMSGRTRVGRESGIPAQDLLHYEVFLAHKTSGDRRFDLAGYNPHPRDAKEEGIRRFKLKWGGTEVPTWTFIKRVRPGLRSQPGRG